MHFICIAGINSQRQINRKNQANKGAQRPGVISEDRTNKWNWSQSEIASKAWTIIS